ncbi:Unknown protein [Striga hermonthica]|uniref:SWIM-type domain-containing protein n=1 Tax=Striga hermonthica TaxID=68872 RepID=A0A9N7NVU1_STRHE|nr:Unknown protein [Striga hermonthica]
MVGVAGYPHIEIDDDGEVIPVDDLIPEERVIGYGSDNPKFNLGARFPDMDKFRLAVTQYAMNEEFELHVAKTTKDRYDGYCKGADDCAWHVHGRSEVKGGKTIIVTAWTEGHTCTSSMRRKITTPSAKWVASRQFLFLRGHLIWDRRICKSSCRMITEQRECFKHLMDNYAKRKRPNTDNMYPAARSYRKEVHEHHHIAIVKSDLDTKEWLEQHHKLKWFRSGFNLAIKCDYVTNNVAEVFNKWIKVIKDLPVCELADKLREMIMVLWHKRRKIGQRLQGKILPAIIHILKAQTRGLSHLNVVQGDNYAAQVVDMSAANIRHVVKAYLHECTCEEWQHTGKPCQHALALITQQPFRDVMMENFVNDYYSVERFKNAYKRIIEPLPDR